MISQCPLNFKIKDDCCLSNDVTVDIVNSNTITNTDSITTDQAATAETFIKTLYFDSGHIVSSQVTKPLASITQAGTPGPGLTGAATENFSTDIVGKVGMIGTPAAGSIAMVTYHVPYPAGSVPNVILTAADSSAAAAIKTSGVFVTSATNTAFTINFVNVLPLGANPAFNYSVTCPVSAS